MRLKKLVLLGFKSFADKTILNFDAGITCIVGPNGCGKSNIADAFRWVLGEQSAKSMRGSRMPDIIFAGANRRQPLNFAEVSITLGDIQNSLPIDYEEITITRRLHRSGDSEYLLNGNPVRLKDVQTLLLGSGIGRNAFSIFEQGKLDQVISYTPIERRYIFEEAAGILRFLQRKKEALKRLEQADLNLSRVNDIHLEVEKQIRTLEDQAKKARIYKEKKEELGQAEIAGYAYRWQVMEKKLSDLQKKYARQQAHCDTSREQCEVVHQQSAEVKQLRQQHEKELRNQTELLATLRGQQEIHARESQSLQQRQSEGRQREKKLKQELEDLSLACRTRKKSISEIVQKREQLDSELSDAELKWINQQDCVKIQEKEVLWLRQELGAKQQIHLKSMHQYSQYQTELKQAEIRIENLTEHQKQLKIRLDHLKMDADHLAASCVEKKKNLQQVSGLVDSHKDRLESLEEELKKATRDVEEKQKESEALRRKAMEAKARQKILLKMRSELEGFSQGTKRLLIEARDPKSPFYQKLRPFYEYFSPKEGAVEALAVVLRTYSQTLVIEREEDARELMTYAEKEGIQDFSLFCESWIASSSRQASPSKTSLLDQVVSNPVSAHFLDKIAIAKSNEDVLTDWLKGKCDEGWSVQGGFFDHRGVFFKIRPSENQVFIRESELNNLEVELNAKEEQLDKIEKALQSQQQRRAQIHLERGELDKMLRRDEMKLVEVNFGLQRSLSDVEKNKQEQARCMQEQSTLSQNLEEQGKTFNALDKLLRQSKQELVQFQQEKEVLQSELDRQESALRIQDQDQKEKGSHYRQLADDRRQMIHQHNLLEAKEQDHAKNVQRIQDELSEWEERFAQIASEEKRVHERLAALEGEVQAASVQCADLEKRGEAVLQQCEQADRQNAWHQNELKKIETELAQLEIQLSHQKAVIQSVIDELEERCGCTVEAAVQISATLNRTLEQNEKLIKSLRQALQDCGDVNLTAIEDLEKHQERFSFLKNQIDDMQVSKKELMDIIRQLDQESHQLFKETFEAIRANFQKNFKILFSGGEADLQLTDTQNILEAGIEISAKPPGKQMRSISLLSGGEKCLTAVALLFAIFEVKPAPFCILDEIDAPLDDANVDRFVNVVKHFVDRCQFLIITHNKRTMAIGDVLFGVSMEERGVSKLLSLEFARRSEEGEEVSVPAASLIS